MSSYGGLTAEQKRRIEENRRRAKEKLVAKQKEAALQAARNNPSKPAIHYPGTVGTTTPSSIQGAAPSGPRHPSPQFKTNFPASGAAITRPRLIVTRPPHPSVNTSTTLNADFQAKPTKDYNDNTSSAGPSSSIIKYPQHSSSSPSFSNRTDKAAVSSIGQNISVVAYTKPTIFSGASNIEKPSETIASRGNNGSRSSYGYGKPNAAYGVKATGASTASIIAQVTSSSPQKTPAGLLSQRAKVRARCVLESSRRFQVKFSVGFSQALIELFKTMETKSYDVNSKTWSFHLKEYHTLMGKCHGLGGEVVLEGFPRCVLTTFSRQIQGIEVSEQHAPEADLSQVEEKLVSTLLPFQRDAINFAILGKGRVLIADDMGLGKTLQSLCIAHYYRREWPLLIVVPSSVRFAWREQILRWLPSIDPQSVNVVVKGTDSCTNGLVNILSYDLMVRQKQQLEDKRFKVIIMDESHLLKNIKAARTKAAMPLLKKASRVILLSGTPALSRPQELFTQISAVDQKIFPKFHEFGVRYCDGQQKQFGWDFSGSSNMTELQLVLEDRIMIRRLKKDVLTQLPTKIREMILLDPSQIKVNRYMKDSNILLQKMKGMERRGALLEYFNETGNAKIPAVREYILERLEAGSKLLMFAHHQVMLDAIENACRDKDFGYIRIDGRTAPETRNQYVEQFQTHEATKVAILSITAANTGLNLTAASLVVFAELFWNPGVLVQAEDRAHRIGQLDSVNVQYLVATGTADDYIWPLVQKKLSVLSEAGLSKDDFSEAETRVLQDPKQKDIMSYFEESFIEESDVSMEQSAADHISSSPSPSPSLKNNSTQTKLAAERRLSGTSPAKSPAKSPGKKRVIPQLKGQASLLKFFPVSPEKSTTDQARPVTTSVQNTTHVVAGEEIPDDWLDDIDDLLLESPNAKKLKM